MAVLRGTLHHHMSFTVFILSLDQTHFYTTTLKIENRMLERVRR
jgi:hypothetical protein